jgi:hypothetical protein
MDEVLGIDPRGGDPVVNRLVADDAAMSSGIDRGSAATDGCIRFVMILCGFAVVGVFGLMIFSIIKACESPAELSKSADQPLDHSPLGHRIVNLTSMVMEAAADRPGCFQELGVTDECYGQVRQAVVDGQGNVPESLWWQLLADQAQQPYPQTDIMFTPANHYMALAFCLDVLQPLYSPQPFDLDVDQTIEAGLDKAVDAALAWNKTNLIDAALHTSKLSPCKTGYMADGAGKCTVCDFTLSMVPGSRSSSTARGTYRPER